MNILFVDDEKIIREGIRDIMDWEAAGCTRLFVAAAAAEAMEVLKQEQIDLVITDICMKKISGTRFARYVKEEHPEVKVILLSAHESFTYAREAIEAGVMKYLLKPVSAEELQETIREVRRSKEEEARRSDRITETEKMVHLYKPILAKEFWKALLRRELVNSTDISRQMQLAGISVPGGMLSCVTVLLTEQDHMETREVQECIKKCLREQLGERVVDIVFLHAGGMVCIIKGESDKEEIRDCKEVLDTVVGMDTCVCQGKAVMELEELPESYEHKAYSVEYYKGDHNEPERLVREAERIIRKQAGDEKLSVHSIAEQLHISSGYLSRIFRRKHEMTCIEYITGVRMERAKMLLQKTNLKHHQIAHETGYSNVYYFSAQFKKVTGETPGQYRRRMGERHV